MSSPPGAAGSPDFTAPGNLEILAHTAASQASDLHGAGETPPFHGKACSVSPGTNCLKLKMSLFNDLLKFRMLTLGVLN